jgi:hypothetical protein
MCFPLLALSMDSLLAAFVLSAAVRPRRYACLAALFGACDMAASALAPVLDVRAPAAAAVIPVLLLLWGALVLLDWRFIKNTRSCSAGGYLLPALLAVDNLLVPGANPCLAGLVSCAMAAGGFALGAAVLRRLVRPAQERRWLGASFIACGLLLTL